MKVQTLDKDVNQTQTHFEPGSNLKKAGMAPWFDMLNHSPMNNAEFTFNAEENTLYVQGRDRITFSNVHLVANRAHYKLH